MNHNEEVPDFLGGPGDMSCRGQDNLWQSRNVLPNPDSKALARKKRDDVDRLNGDLEGPFLRKAPGSPRLLPTLWLSWKR